MMTHLNHIYPWILLLENRTEEDFVSIIFLLVNYSKKKSMIIGDMTTKRFSKLL